MMYEIRVYFWYSISHTADIGILVPTFIISLNILLYILHERIKKNINVIGVNIA